MLHTIERAITPERTWTAAKILIAIFGLTTLAWLATTRGLMDVFGQPVGGDFILFYAASKLTLHGHAAAAFDPAALLAAQRAVIPGVRPGLEWCYPPTFQLLIAPLGLAPFPLAYAVFLAAGLAPFLLLVRAIAPGPRALAGAVALPGTFVNAWQGQNGFLTGSALGYGLSALDRRPWLSGAVLGLLVCKPQFGVLLPILLIGTGRWRSVIATATSALALVAISAAAFGLAPWRAFFATAPEVSRSLSEGLLPWAKMASVFVAARWLGAPIAAAGAIQAVVAALAAVATLVAWRRPGPAELKVGLAILATFLMTPYAFNYDLALLAIPLAAALAASRAEPLPRGGKVILVAGAFAPVAFLGLAKLTHVQLMPVAIAALFLLLLRMLRRGQTRSAPRPAAAEVCAGAPGALV